MINEFYLKAGEIHTSRMIICDATTIESMEIEAVFSKTTQVIAWRELQDDSVWRQGWV